MIFFICLFFVFNKYENMKYSRFLYLNELEKKMFVGLLEIFI